MDSFERFNDTNLLIKEDFFGLLSDKHINDKS